MANACIFHPFTLVAAPSDCELDQSMANTCTFRSFMDVGVLRVGGGGEDNMENTFVVQPTLSAVKSTCGHERDQWACCEWGAKLETTVLVLIGCEDNTCVVQPTLSAVKSTCGYERDQWACCEWGAKLETTVSSR
jgi:hypothetical protein